MMIEIREGVSLAQYSSWLVGGEAEFYVAPTSIEEVNEAVVWARKNKKEVTILSGGTNVLISDSGISDLVIHLRKLQSVEESVENGRHQIVALAGTSKAKLLKSFLKKKLPPALFLAGLPGDVGGGIAMNAGIGETWVPREFVEITDWIEVLNTETNEIKRYAKEDLKWGYRSCKGWQPGIILRAQLSWPDQPDETILDQVKAANKSRMKKQPLEYPSCGSVFRNPLPRKSGQLIEECGLKGHTMGGAQVSEKHANFIINKDKASAKDIAQMILHVQKTVKDQTGIDLETEVVFLGFESLHI